MGASAMPLARWPLLALPWRALPWCPVSWPIGPPSRRGFWGTWAKLAQVVDGQDRPLFPFVGAPGLNGQNALGTSSASSWNGNPLGLVLVVDKNMAGSTGSGGLNGVVGHAAGPAAGFEFYEQIKGAVSVEVPSILGRTIAWRGYAATFMADATKFCKLLAA